MIPRKGAHGQVASGSTAKVDSGGPEALGCGDAPGREGADEHEYRLLHHAELAACSAGSGACNALQGHKPRPTSAVPAN